MRIKDASPEGWPRLSGAVFTSASRQGRRCPECGALLEITWWETAPWERLPGRFGADVSCLRCTPIVRTVTDAGWGETAAEAKSEATWLWDANHPGCRCGDDAVERADSKG